MAKPTEGMKSEARKGLDWRKEFGRGGTRVGLERANQIVNNENLSDETIKRMFSFFSRHEVDKQAKGFRQGEKGYPSNGRIAWALWGGDAGFSWSRKLVNQMKKDDERNYDERPYPNEHAARITDPKNYVSFARENNKLGKGIDVVYGIKGNVSDIQSIRFDAKEFTADEAIAWLDGHDYKYTKFEEAIGERSTEDTLREKARKHNEEVGDNPAKRTSYSTLQKVYNRGIGAYNTNPSSVRPNVTSKEQWAMARVNNFLRVLKTGKYKSGKHDTDLLPESHPLSSKNKEKAMNNKDDRHILNVSETDDKVVVEFAKHEDVQHDGDEVEMIDAENSMHEDENDRKVIDMPMKYRTIDLTRDSHIDEENRRVRVGVSSEEPVERSFGKEVLSHKAGDINMEFIAGGTAPLLLDHDMSKQVGVVESFKLDETAKRTIAVVRFGKSQLASEVFEDVKDGIRMNISVGYRIDKLERETRDGDDYYRAKWTPMEVSSVSIPADQSRLVGVGRSKTNLNNNKEIIVEDNKKEINLDEVKSDVVKEARSEFKKNSKEILDLAAKHNRRDLAHKAISDGLSIEEFRGVLLDNISNGEPLETHSDIGMTKEEVKRFSLVKAIRALANPADRKAQADAEFEFECSEAAAREYGKDAQGIMLPADVLRNWNSRTLSAGSDTTLISEDYRGGDFIDVLRNASSVMSAGATMLQGLSGNVVIPKKDGASSAAWISSEGGDAGDTEFGTGSVTMSPKVIGARTDATRLLLQQSSLDVENLIRDDLTQALALAIDLGALAGSGTGGQPTGIKNTTGINTTIFGAAVPTYAEVVAMESEVATDNALLGNLGYICTPADYGSLKTTSKDSGSGQFVVEPDGRINGYNVVRSGQVTSGDFYFGNFADLLIGMYGGLDITVDPYALSTSGGIRIIALQTVDVAVRHAASFCVSNDNA